MPNASEEQNQETSVRFDITNRQKNHRYEELIKT